MNIPEGWKLVPVDPTEEMLDSFLQHQPYENRSDKGIRDYFMLVYKLALAAAPTPPAQEDEPVAEVGEDYVFLLRKQDNGDRWPAGTKLYTRPDNDKLMKVAEEYMKLTELTDMRFQSEDHDRDHLAALKSLRAALEGK